MADRFDVLIVGAGHSGAQAAIMLRQRHFAGSIALLGDEPHQPYERPPLSKDYLSGEKPFERILIRPESFWGNRNIELLLGRRVTAIDPNAHRVTLTDQSTLGYGVLIWATGGSPRRLSCAGHDLKGVHTVRTRADVDEMRSDLGTIAQVVVVGAAVHGAAVIPDHEIMHSPAVDIDELALCGVRSELVDQRTAFGLRHAENAADM